MRKSRSPRSCRYHLSREQIAATLELMTLNHALIEDGTYLITNDLGTLVTCGS